MDKTGDAVLGGGWKKRRPTPARRGNLSLIDRKFLRVSAGFFNRP